LCREVRRLNNSFNLSALCSPTIGTLHTQEVNRQGQQMNVLSRNINSTSRKVLLVLLFLAVAIGFAVSYFAQQQEVTTISNLNTSDIIAIDVVGQSVVEPARIERIVSELKHAKAYSFSQGGCFPPVRMTIRLRSGSDLQLGVALVPKDSSALIQVIAQDLPPCIFGRPMYSTGLPNVLSSMGIDL